MAWELFPQRSQSGESVGSKSKIGFRGTRFSISKAGRLYLTDYGNNINYHNDADSYVQQIRHIMGPGWAGRLRLRANGDTYCVASPGWVYVGNTNLGDDEQFSGYNLGAGGPPCPLPYPGLYMGPHTHGQVGERWTIPERAFARSKDKIGNVGIRITKGDWNWSSSKHQGFIEKMRSIFHLEPWLRFYINCYGYVLKPINSRFWDAYNIDVVHQFSIVANEAPRAARSIETRIDKRSEDADPNLYFVCGHIDDLMDGNLPSPDPSDPRTGGHDQDMRQWG